MPAKMKSFNHEGENAEDASDGAEALSPNNRVNNEQNPVAKQVMTYKQKVKALNSLRKARKVLARSDGMNNPNFERSR